ncbi:endo alpha-1,4 polygalactosaminidase [Streptomyces sp. NPDC087300]|uniref:endo alpha-1,4 polygalactosaminidase n=1 Tax=Streptomyces sp. NPDC087300 TaxID=3365780 RepID=UPI00382F0FDF
MRNNPARPRHTPFALLGAAAVLSLLATACSGENTSRAPEGASSSGAPSSSAVTPPPAHAGFDYQLGGAYTPPEGVSVVVRDHTSSPASGVYNVCYVNAFQAQPGAEQDWDDDLLLRDDAGKVVMDKDWDETILDISTKAKRERVAEKVGTWIDSCAHKGFKAVEPDNYDSYTRAPDGLLTPADAKAFLALLAEHAHDKGLAIGQKNTASLARDRKRVGLDFAVVEECGQYDECGAYTKAFGDRLLVIEYTERGLKKACDGWGDKVSIVRRDLDVVPAGDEGYVRETCADL